MKLSLQSFFIDISQVLSDRKYLNRWTVMTTLFSICGSKIKRNVRKNGTIKMYCAQCTVMWLTCWKAALIWPCPMSCSICSCCTWASTIWGAGVTARDRTAVITLLCITSSCTRKPLAICSFIVSQTDVFKLSWMLKEDEIKRQLSIES